MMETRNAVHPEHAVLFDTAEMREHFLIENLYFILIVHRPMRIIRPRSSPSAKPSRLRWEKWPKATKGPFASISTRTV